MMRRRRMEAWSAYQAIEQWLTTKRDSLAPGEIRELEEVADELWEYLSRRPWYKGWVRKMKRKRAPEDGEPYICVPCEQGFHDTCLGTPAKPCHCPEDHDHARG